MDEGHLPESFWAVRCHYGGTQYHVSEEEGFRLRAALLAAKPPAFVGFEDLGGSQVVLQTDAVESLFLSTPDTRAFDKAWNAYSQRLNRESQPEPERPWESD